MRRVLYILLPLLLLPIVVSAQVAKQVEVSKDYKPSVSSAQKLALTPDMTDTVKMRPDIDYTITPRSYETSLMTENFKPATITYWDYQRSSPLYVRGAVGVPLTSEGDVYISTYNKDRGYAMAYANHWGDYRNRYNLLGEKVEDNTSEMSNRVGGRAGLFVGRHLLEVDLYGDHQLRHRYPSTGEKITFGRGVGKLRFGDDFSDLSRWNFNVELGGSVFANEADAGDFNLSTMSARAEVGKIVGDRHILRIHAQYDGAYGAKQIEAYKNNTFKAGMRYGVTTERLEMLIGADYYYDNVKESTDSPHHIYPYLHLMWKNTSEGFVPYVEVDGGLKRNDYSTLLYTNPYLRGTSAVASMLPSLDNESVYNGRAGFGGNLGDGLFVYNVSAELSIADDHAYWYAVGADYSFVEAYQHSLRIDAEAKVRPSGWFEAEAKAGVYVWENYDDFYSNRPNFNASLDLRYTGRKLHFGVGVGYQGPIKWMVADVLSGETRTFGYQRTDGTFLVGVDAEYRVNDRWSIFAEGRNLAGSKIYDWLGYYRDTQQCLLGVKITF